MNRLLENTVKALELIEMPSGVGNARCAELERGILDVAIMIAALDGEVLPSERTAAESIVRLFRSVPMGNESSVIADAFDNAEQVLAERKRGATDKELVGFLILRSVLVLPAGFAGQSVSAVRFALILWLGMCLSDGAFDSVERLAFWRLLDCFIPRPENLRPGLVRPTPEQLACRNELERFVLSIADLDAATVEQSFLDLLGKEWSYS